MYRVLQFVVICVCMAVRPADGATLDYFWDLKPAQIRQLVASPQVLVTRRGSAVGAFCRCPVALRPDEIPKVMKNAIIAIEDKRFFDHDGVDIISARRNMNDGMVAACAYTVPDAYGQ